MALAILAVAFFGRQLGARQAALRAGYQQAGAASFVAELSGVPDGEVDPIASAIGASEAVESAQAPYNGLGLGLVADTSFIVFRNERQEEYLGARTNVLGVDPTFDSARDYFVDFHDINPGASRLVLGIPLLANSVSVRAPRHGEILAPSDVADYVGVAPGASAIVELAFVGVSPPIVRRIEALELARTFDVVGPDRGRFEPFWRFAARGEDVLTIRRPDATDAFRTTLPILLDAKVIRDFLTLVQQELARRRLRPMGAPSRDQIAIRAKSLGGVPMAEAAVTSLLRRHGLRESCEVTRPASFCLRLPERNNFLAALDQESKLQKGGAFLVALLLVLLAVGGAGLQVQAVLARWHDYGVLQALGFSRGQILAYHGLQILLILAAAVGLAMTGSLLLPTAFAGSALSLASACAISVVVAGLASLAVLWWPLSRVPAELLRSSA